MKKFIFTLIALSGIFICNSQTITIEKDFWEGTKFIQNEERITVAELSDVLESNTEAFELFKKAKTNGIIATIFSAAGGALIGYQIGTAVGGGDPNWVLAGVGAGSIAISIPISINASKQVKQAIGIYNAQFNSTSYHFKPEFKMIANTNGFGLSMNF